MAITHAISTERLVNVLQSIALKQQSFTVWFLTDRAAGFANARRSPDRLQPLTQLPANPAWQYAEGGT